MTIELGREEPQPTKVTGANDGRPVWRGSDDSHGGQLLRGMLDAMTDEAIQSNFDDRVLGRLLNRCLDQFELIESAIAFVSVIAKARLARRRRGRQP